MPERFDVAVVGAGPAGVSAAVHLTKLGFSVCLASDRECASAARGETWSARVAAEAGAVGLHLSTLSALTLPSAGLEAVWSSPSPTFASQILDPLGPSRHVDRARIGAALRELAIRAGVRVQLDSHFLNAVRGGSTWTVKFRGAAETTECSFLVDATGGASSVAHAMGARRVRHDSLCGVSAVFTSTAPFRMLAVEATPYGWWYATPLLGDRVMACVMSDADILQAMRAMTPRKWLSLFTQTTFVSHLFGHNIVTIIPRVHACATAMLDPVTGSGWLAVGDAASTFDPLSSAGVLKAFMSGREAATAVAKTLGGDVTALEGYTAHIENTFFAYLLLKKRHYEIQPRWRTEPFWSRRAKPMQ